MMEYQPPSYMNYTWSSISNNAYTSWARSSNCTVNTTTGVITMTPTALNWSTTLTSNSLKYTWAQVKNGKKFHIKFDYTISNATTTSDAYLAVAIETKTTASPTSTTGRTAYSSFGISKDSASGTFDKYGDIVMLTDTPADTNYFCVKIYAYTGANSVVTLKNIVAEVN